MYSYSFDKFFALIHIFIHVETVGVNHCFILVMVLP